MFGGAYFNQYAFDFNEHSWKTFDNRQNTRMSLLQRLEMCVLMNMHQISVNIRKKHLTIDRIWSKNKLSLPKGYSF